MTTSFARLMAGCGCSILLICSAPLRAAQPAVDTAAAPAIAPITEDDGDALAPGQYLWRPELATDGALSILVDLDQQRAYVYRGETLIGLSTVSTGRDGHETPVGVFPILAKEVTHRSNLYDAPMPYMQRLTWDGVALHAGGVPGYRESHGCVHLPPAFAKALFAVTDLGATVTIRGGTPGAPIETTAVDPSDGIASVGAL